MIENLKSEITNLKVKIKTASGDEFIALKEKYHKKELELINIVKFNTATKSNFNPSLLKHIEALKLEKVCLNYIPFIKGAYNILTGKGGSGKSAVALKSMIEYLKLNPNKNALCFFTEDGKDDIDNRINIICKTDHHETIANLKSRINFITIENDDRIKWVKNVRDEYIIQHDYINDVIAFCKNNNIGFIILDPLKRFHSLNENSNDDMDILVRDIFIDIAIKTEAVLLVLHHSSKGGEFSSASRGASTITDSARIGWHLGRYYKRNSESKEMILDESMKSYVRLSIIKDNLGLESSCTIRKTDDNSILNPLSGLVDFGNARPTETIEYKHSMPDIEF